MPVPFLKVQRFDAAYYIAGYSVECALKACVSKLTRRYDFPNKELALDVHTHDLKKLLKAAGIADAFENEMRRDRELGSNWGVVKDWHEISRYDRGGGQAKAHDMIEAIGDPAHGVLQCIRKYW